MTLGVRLRYMPIFVFPRDIFYRDLYWNKSRIKWQEQEEEREQEEEQ